MNAGFKIALAANTSWFLYNFMAPFIRELVSRKAHVLALAPLDDFSDRIERLGVRFVPVAMERGGLNPFSDAGLTRRLYGIYASEKPDAAFQVTIKPVIYGTTAASLAGISNITNMIPGLGYVFIGQGVGHVLLRPLVHRMYRHSLARASKVLFQNRDDAGYFLQHRLVDPAKAIVTSGLGIDLGHYAYAEPVSRDRVCTFLMLGRMLWDKGVGEFVEAARVVKHEFPQTRFQLLGKIDEHNPARINKDVLLQWNSEGSVEYLGEVSDVRPVIARADVVVLPSYREGVPQSLLEGMAMGKAIIATDVPGCRETVDPGVNGFLVPPRDVQALAEAERSLARDGALRARMGKAGRRLATDRFDVRIVNDILLKAVGLG